MAKRPRIYLAGPDVFLPDAVAIGRRKKELCLLFGFVGLFPFDNEIPPLTSSERADLLIYRANIRMIREADAAIFNLTPFRGPSADVGTVFELGVFVGLGKPVFGYTNRAGDYLSRVVASGGVGRDPAGAWRELDWPVDRGFRQHGQPYDRGPFCRARASNREERRFGGECNR